MPLPVDNVIHPCEEITIAVIQIESSVPYQFVPDMPPSIQMGVLANLWISHLRWLKALNVLKSFPLSSSLLVVSNTASSHGRSHAGTWGPVFSLSLPSVFWFSPHHVSTCYFSTMVLIVCTYCWSSCPCPFLWPSQSTLALLISGPGYINHFPGLLFWLYPLSVNPFNDSFFLWDIKLIVTLLTFKALHGLLPTCHFLFTIKI